jgi:uncharacterized protein (TIGR02588 family)
MSSDEGRSAAEWTTFAVSCLILLAVVAVIGVQMFETPSPPAPVATAGEVHLVSGRHHVEVTVTNEGDETAANVQISAELVVDGEATTADQTVDFLAGSETVDLVFVFDDDPRAGELAVTVGGFALP